VRIFVTPLCLLLGASALLPAAAEVIRLKNGEVIYADEVDQDSTKVHYQVGDNSFTIPRSKVQSVEAGPANNAGSGTVVVTPNLAPEVQVAGEGDLLEQVVHNHQVDRGALATIESRRDTAATAVAYYLAAKSEYEGGKYADSKHDFETALRFQPESPAILTYYAALLIRTGNYLDAVSYARRATQIVPDSPDAFSVLGYAEFAASRNRDAIASWKKSLALRPDQKVQEMLDRAERESSAEANYSERETGHFVLHFEGSNSSEAFREQLLATLESQYQDLSRIFGGEPRSSVQVVLYTTQAFFDVTRAPSWIGAINDGKLRIPLHGVDSVTPELARVLRHELTHSFVAQISAGRCPAWLNEGIAQMLEPRSLAGRIPQLSALFKAEREIPLNMLEHTFSSLSTQEAVLAYDESLLAASYVYGRYGMPDMMRVLQRIGQGDSAESSMRSVLHSDYGQLEDEIRAELSRQSGN
jgi:tetratricopeptide (TPR) repeat protein